MKPRTPLVLDLAVFALWLVLVISAFTNADAQMPPPVNHIHLSVQANHVLDSLAQKSRFERVETAACLTNYAVRDSTLEIETLGPANYVKADSVNIWSITTTDSTGAVQYQQICDAGVPSLHSHVAWGGAVPPSDTDINTEKMRGIWNLLLQVRENGWLLFLF